MLISSEKLGILSRESVGNDTILETAVFGSLLLASSITTGGLASQSLIFHPVHTSTCQQPVFY